MTMTMTMPDRPSRWLLIGSLALNLFFVGTLLSLPARAYLLPGQSVATERPRSAAARIERLAAPLPIADAEKLRAAFRARESAAEGARDALNKAYERAQGVLKTEPFDAAALRAALADARAARPAYDQTMQEILIAGASAMSPEGRAKLADWPPPRPATNAR